MFELKWGIIGLGFFGEKHADVLSQVSGVCLHAVSTRREARLQAIAGRFGVPTSYTDYRDLLASPDVDVVSVTTHIHDHCQIVLDALKAGKHVFLEKPMAGTVEDSDAIVDAARSSNTFLMVGHICRFDPRVALAREAIERGDIGRIVSLHARRNLPAKISAEVLDKISPLMGDGIHDTDIMLWLTGEPVESVYAQNVRVRNFTYPDIGWAMLRFAGGAVGVVETVWHLPASTPYTIDARMEVIGEKGALYIDCGQAGLEIHGHTGVNLPDTGYWPELFGRRIGALRNELEYFADCLRNHSAPDQVTPVEARNAVACMCAAETAATENRVVKPDWR